MSNGGGILLARGGGQLLTCVACKRPTPNEHIAPTGPREGICGDCWGRAGKLRGWMLQPSLGNGLPVLDVMNLLLSEQGGSGRGNDRNPIRTLARLLREHEELRRKAAEDGTWGEVVCYYCGADPDHHPEGESLVEVQEADGLPVIWHCSNFEACDERLFQRLMRLLAQTIQAQQAVAGLVKQ